MRIGLFFGSFNPPHLGHTIIAAWMREAMGADEVWMVVSPQNPFKEKKGLLEESKRLELVRLAVADLEGIEASDFEFGLDRPSYTIDTMNALSMEYPQHDFELIMGSDNILQIHEWKNAEDLLAYFEIVVYPRKGYEVSEEFRFTLPQTVRFIDCPLVELSSTMVRTRIKQQQEYSMLLHPAVTSSISEEGFYQ